MYKKRDMVMMYSIAEELDKLPIIERIKIPKKILKRIVGAIGFYILIMIMMYFLL